MYFFLSIAAILSSAPPPRLYTNSVESILDFKSPFNRFTAEPSPRRSLLHRISDAFTANR